MHDDHAFELLSASVDGELAPDEQHAVDAHLEGCPACRDLHHQLEGVRRRALVAPARTRADTLAEILALRDADRADRRTTHALARRAAAAAAVVVAISGGIWALDGPGAPGPSPATDLAAVTQVVRIDARSRSFDRADVQVAPGAVVEWRNAGDTRHRLVRKLGGAVIEEDLPPGRSESVTFAEPGTYEYYCTIHAAMAGTVTVES